MRVEVPEAFGELFEPMRFKVYYGGRGSGKSHSFAMAALIRGINRPTRILCARELQISIADSVHKLLADKIMASDELSAFYTVQQASIKGINGTEFLFKGMKHNSTEIKSTEGIDICWVEEAEKVSDASWELLIPTIRKEGSEIWVSFNNKQPTDATYRLLVANKREDSIVKKVSWRDNPWFPDVLRKEMEHLKKVDYEAYLHVWEGEFDTRFFGGVYSKQLIRAEESGRIVESAFCETAPVNTAWDLGYDDATAIVFWQRVGDEIRIVDYHEDSGQDIPSYAKVLREKAAIGSTLPDGRAVRWRYDKHIVPHDAKHKLLAAGGKSIVEQFYRLGIKMYAMPVYAQQQQIEATRAMLETCWFTKATTDRLRECLRSYQFKYNEDLGRFESTPKHDQFSHGADALETLSQFRVREVKDEKKAEVRFLDKALAHEVFWPTDQGPQKHERWY